MWGWGAELDTMFLGLRAEGHLTGDLIGQARLAVKEMPATYLLKASLQNVGLGPE